MTSPTDDRMVAGRYRPAEMLGRGGMGTVWRAYDTVLDRVVAMKELRVPDDLDDEERGRRSARAMREVRAAALVSHPNVVVVYDVVEDDGRPWIIMELVVGRTLADDLDEGRLPIRDAARVTRHLLEALRAVHAASVVHRDVKPGNVLIANDGRAVLTDFGIATLVGSTTITATGTTIGTLEYMAPERAQGLRPGPASDLWSLGATLYEMVEGRSPFRRNGEFATLQAVLDGTYDPPRHAGPLGDVLAGLLESDPERRLTADGALRVLAAAGYPGADDGGGHDVHGEGEGADGGGGVDPAGSAATTAGVPAPSTTLREAAKRAEVEAAGAPERAAVGAASGNAHGGQSPVHNEPRGDGAPPPKPAASPRVGPQDGAGSAGTGPEYVPEPASAEPASVFWPHAASHAELPTYSGLARVEGGTAAGVNSPPRQGSRRARLAVTALVVLMIAVGVGVGLGLAGDDDGKGERAPTAAGPGDSAPRAGDQGTDVLGDSGPQGSPAPPSATNPATPPAATVTRPGYRRVDDPSGFSVLVPEGWTGPHQDRDRVFYRSSGNLTRLGVRVNPADSSGDPCADLSAQDAGGTGESATATYPGYMRVQLAATTHDGKRGCLWEFTWDDAGTQRRSVNLRYTDGVRMYDFWVSGPVSATSTVREVFEAAKSSFAPTS